MLLALIVEEAYLLLSVAKYVAHSLFRHPSVSPRYTLPPGSFVIGLVYPVWQTLTTLEDDTAKDDAQVLPQSIFWKAWLELITVPFAVADLLAVLCDAPHRRVHHRVVPRPVSATGWTSGLLS
jgi:hypothetical protein